MGTVTQTQGSTNEGSAAQPQSLTGSTGRDRVAHAWRQVRAVLEEMNDAVRRSAAMPPCFSYTVTCPVLSAVTGDRCAGHREFMERTTMPRIWSPTK
jgi:hypothetical protein